MKVPVVRTLAVAAASAVVAAGLWPAGAAAASRPQAATLQVPCSTAALTSDISKAAETQTLSLAAGCVYVLTQGLQTSGGVLLTIEGNGATLERSYVTGTPAFSILQVNSFGVILHQVTFRNGANAIFVSPGNSVDVNGCTFTANTGSAGGAISGGGPESAVTVENSTFIGNTATYGGAIIDNNIFGIVVTNSKFYHNQAQYGGAIYNDSVTGESFTNVVLRDNQASGDGGGIYSAYSQVTFDGSQISANQATGSGGGIYQLSVGEGQDPEGVVLTGTDVAGNSATLGGGIYLSASVADIEQGSVDGNRASSSGGGIFNEGDPDGYLGQVTLQGSKMASNNARGQGGGVYNQGSLTATGTPFTSNTAAGGGAIYEHSAFGPATATATVANSPMRGNQPDNCEPPKSVTGCTG
jgi:predicted outer membrane repeat protein